MYKKNNKNNKGRIFIACLIFFWMVALFNVPVFVQAADVPRVVLQSYSVVEGTFDMGEKSVVKLKLKNTHKNLAASNLLMTYKCESNNVYSTFGKSNQIYIDEIPADTVVEKNIELTVSKTTEAVSVPLTFQLSYIDKKTNVPVDEDFIIYVPVNGMSFVNSVSVASSTTIGAQTYISANLNNSGYTDAYDVKMIVEGDVKAGNKDASDKGKGKIEFNLGNMLNGDKNYNENSIIFNKTGQQTIKISFVYKDKSGEVHKEVAGDYTVNVIEKEKIFDNTVVKVANSRISFAWLIYASCGLLAAIIMIVLAVKAKRR